MCVCVCVTALAWSFSRHFRSCDGAPAALPGSTVAVEPVRAEPRDRVKRALAMRTHVSALRIPLRRPLVPRAEARSARAAECHRSIGTLALAPRVLRLTLAPLAPPHAAVAEAPVARERSERRKRPVTADAEKLALVILLERSGVSGAVSRRARGAEGALTIRTAPLMHRLRRRAVTPRASPRGELLAEAGVPEEPDPACVRCVACGAVPESIGVRTGVHVEVYRRRHLRSRTLTGQ